MTEAPPRGVVGLLIAQALAFGVTLALLIIPANALFLDAYGSEWLPATYVAIAVIGSGASALIARAARRTRLVRVATPTLGALALLYAASWAILVGGGVWVSAVLLVLFPIALQVGFVFIGGQAGRLLDVRQLKERFPHIVSGFAVGFLLGGLLGIPLLALLGSTEHLLLGTAAAQLAFLGLVLATERRFPEVRAPAPVHAPAVARPPLRTLFASGLVLLLLVYQVLSAMGSQVVDFLLFDRAAAQYSGDELTRFLSAYTALLNLVDILFLALVAGPLMRRFGLRLGLVLNPAVVAAVLAVMALVVAGPGAASYGLFVLAAVLRVADITATDGTTRTSINAAYQVVPVEERLAVQAVVEGVGVPVAIGVTGVLLLVLNVLELGTGAVIVFGLVLGAVWTAIAVGAYRSYTRALADQMRRRSLVADGFDVAEDDQAAVRGLLRSDDARDVRLGLDLLAGLESQAAAVELRQVAAHADPEVRVRALAQLAAGGDVRAAGEVAVLVGDLARSPDPADRRAAAAALGSREAVSADASVLVSLLGDPDPTVQAAALAAVASEDAGEPEIVRLVVAAVEEPRTAGNATAAIARLGAPAVPLLRAALTREGTPARASLVRAAAIAAKEHGVAVIAPALTGGDRAIVVTALDALAAADAQGVVPPDLLDDLFRDAATHAARAAAARASLDAREIPLRRALDDEIELARRLVVAVLALRHGDRVRAAVRVVDRAGGQRRALGVEALDVILSRDEAAIALPLVRRDLATGEDAGLESADTAARGPEQWIAEIAADPEGSWRSRWLAACARHAAGR
ncbi:MAG TPA: HEAT repeat domain-containing protein [Gaiellaceae bacterium]